MPDFTSSDAQDRLNAHEAAIRPDEDSGLVSPMRDALNKSLAALEVAEAEAARLRDSYVPFEIASELLEMLTAAGYGKVGEANTLWAMVKAACEEVRDLRFANTKLYYACSILVRFIDIEIPQGSDTPSEVTYANEAMDLSLATKFPVCPTCGQPSTGLGKICDVCSLGSLQGV